MIYFLLFLFSFVSFSKVEIPLFQEREYYLKLIRNGSLEKDFFRQGSKVTSLLLDTCNELNNVHEGVLYNSQNEKLKFEIALNIDCNSPQKRSEKASFKIGNTGKVSKVKVDASDFYKIQDRGYSIIGDKYMLKFFVWSGFRGHRGIVSFMLYDKDAQEIYLSKDSFKKLVDGRK